MSQTVEAPPMQLIDEPGGLQRVAQTLRGSSRLYLDTEFESNRSGTRICLLQLSGGGEIFLVDSLRLRSLEPLRDVLAAPETEWVLHAGLQDVQLLIEELRIEPPKLLFDTQIAWGLLTAESSVSLGYLQYKVLGERSNKAHQADDWTRRPLPASQLAYAAADVAHLPALREHLGERARQLAREAIVHRASLELLQPTREPLPPLALESFRNAWQLEPRQQAGLRYVISWYNGLSAAQREGAPETKTLLSIASRLPDSVEALGRIKGVSPRFVQRAGKELVAGLRRAASQARAEDFVPIEPAPYATFEDIRLDAWLTVARAEVCATLQASPELILPGRLLKSMRAAALAGRAGAAALAGISGWRRELVEEAFLRFCQDHPAPL